MRFGQNRFVLTADQEVTTWKADLLNCTCSEQYLRLVAKLMEGKFQRGGAAVQREDSGCCRHVVCCLFSVRCAVHPLHVGPSPVTNFWHILAVPGDVLS